MSLHLHWFLPTNGDGRDIVGGGHGVATGSAGAIRFSHDGEHLRVAGARLSRRPDPVPPLYFGGSSAEAGPVAARYSDVYLTWGEPPAAVDAKLRWIDGLSRQAGRTLRYGIRLHVITRDTAHEARLQANRLIERIDEATIRKVQQGLAHSESEGQRRMRELHGGSADNLEISPNLWAGVGLRRGHRAGRQPCRGRRPDRGVRRSGHLRVHPVRVPPPGGGLSGRRGRAAHLAPARPLASSRAGPRRRPRQHDTVLAHVRSRLPGHRIVTSLAGLGGRRYHVPARARAHQNRREMSCESR
jgi:Luciferase-like monooxygenase